MDYSVHTKKEEKKDVIVDQCLFSACEEANISSGFLGVGVNATIR